MKLSLNFSEPQEVTPEIVLEQLQSIADLIAMQKYIRDIINKTFNKGVKPNRVFFIDLALCSGDKDINLAGTLTDYARIYQMTQAKYKDLENEIKNTN